MKKQAPILICEDNESILLVTRFTLELEGFIVETAQSTAELFLKLNTIKPFLILLDLNLPEAGGALVIQQLRSRNDTLNIPIVLFSGEKNLEKIASELNADGFLRKPFDVEDLKIIVRKFVPNASVKIG